MSSTDSKLRLRLSTPPRSDILRLLLSDYDAIDHALRTTSRRKTAICIQSDHPSLHLRLRLGIGAWIYQREAVRGIIEPTAIGLWPHMDLEKALAMAARMRVADEARITQPPPPQPLGPLLEHYAATKLSKSRSRDVMLRSLRQVLPAAPGTDARHITTDELRATLTAMGAGAPTQAIRCLAYVNAFFRWAMKCDLLSVNPAEEISEFKLQRRPRRTLPIEELAEVWRAAATLDYPQRHAIQLRILLPLPAEVIGALAASSIREAGPAMVWDPSFDGAAEPGRQSPRVWPAAVADLVRDAISQRASPSEVILHCPDGRAVDWAACKRAVGREVQRQRREESRRPQAAWHLDELARSFEAIALTTLGVDRALARRCQEKFDKFRSLHRQSWAESDACGAEVAEVLRRWSELIAAFTRHPISEEVHLVDSNVHGDPAAR